MYLLLFLFLIIILIVSYIGSGYELLAPAPSVAMSMCVATLLAAVGTHSWNDTSLKLNVFVLLFVGTASMSAGSLLVHLIFKNKMDSQLSKANLDLKQAASFNRKIILFVPLILIVSLIHIAETYRIGQQLGLTFTSYMDLTSQVRDRTSSLFTGDYIGFDVGYSFVSRQLDKLMTAISFVCSVYFPIVILKYRSVKKTIPIAILFCLVCLASLLNGGRYMLLMYFIASILSTWVQLIRMNRMKAKGLSKHFFILGALLAIIFIPLFFLLASIVGRGSNSSIVNYLSFYLGCGIPSFQKIVDEGVFSYGIQGFNTFHEQMAFLSKIGLISGLPGYGSYWINFDGFSSNVFTFVYRYYADFGLFGVLFFSLLSGLVYGLLYELTVRKDKYFLLSILYPVMTCHLVDICRDEKFFSTLLSVGNLVTLSMVGIIAIWLTWPKDKRIFSNFFILKS